MSRSRASSRQLWPWKRIWIIGLRCSMRSAIKAPPEKNYEREGRCPHARYSETFNYQVSVGHTEPPGRHTLITAFLLNTARGGIGRSNDICISFLPIVQCEAPQCKARGFT